MPNLKVVIINGSGTSGKDEFIKYVEKRVFAINHSTIDTIKSVCQRLGCDPNEKTNAARNFWSDVKDAWIRYNDGPFEELKKKVSFYKILFGSCTIVMFVHVREPEEMKKIKDFYGDDCISVLVVRDNIEVPNCKKDLTKNVTNFTYDWVVTNNGTELELSEKEKDFCSAFFIF